MPELHRAVRAVLPAGTTAVEPVSGGDISQAYRVHTASGWRFLKVLPDAPAGFFAAEAAGLRWLASPAVMPVPEVLEVGPTHLLLPWLPPGQGSAASDERLGRGLAALHGSLGAGDLGPGDNFIGRLPQDNAPVEGDWAAFYRERRLEPQLEAAAPTLSPALLQRLDRLLGELDTRLGAVEPLARLHGDLWSGNVHVDARGTPWLVDPAASAGHRELDLAMMHLFGGFSARVFDAYAEVAPLAAGEPERRPLHQLYYLLVHVNLFGASWVPRVVATLERLGL